MRIPTSRRFILFALLTILITSCKKKLDTLDGAAFQKDRLTELIIPLEHGKYITYRVDSTVFTKFGDSTEIHSYQIKHVVDTIVTDNLGRPSYRVFTYISDSTGTQSWVPNGSYFITVLDDRMELVEDNLRVIKLHLPIENGNHWKGNSYLADDPYSPGYSFSNDDDMASWDFLIDGDMQSSLTIQDQTYQNVYTVSESNDIDPIVDPSDYGSVSVAQEFYSKDIGLVYRELTLWEQQPNPSGNPPDITYNPYRVGFGMKMWMIDHN